MVVFQSFLTALVLALAAMPVLIRIAQQRGFVDLPDQRKLHQRPIPLLGGLGIVSSFLLAVLFWSAPWFVPEQLFLLTALLVVFLMGLRDDLLPLGPQLKLAGQGVAALIVVVPAGYRLHDLNGLLGMHLLDGGLSVALSVLFVLFVMNAFNFIDGADGLAALLSGMASIAFVAIFSMAGDQLFALMAASLAGALLGFLPFNMQPARIFMGDAGSLPVGLLLAVFSIRMLALSPDLDFLPAGQLPSILLGLLIVPVVDLLRVITLRVFAGKSPLSPDRYHIHYRLLELGWSHRRVSLTLFVVNLGFLSFTVFASGIGSPSQTFLITLLMGLLFSQLPYWLLRRKISDSALK
jgi:UDP-N-acetylmuramyl pentapeptide phosphotransferase/UDP-N-acetylglucosamine-1-phosphate transferase